MVFGKGDHTHIVSPYPKIFMLTHSYTFQNLTTSENGTLTLSEVQERYHDKSVSSHAIGRAMKKIFPAIMIKSVRIKEKKTLTKLYYGSLEQSTCSLSVIKSLLGDDFFLIHESERNVKVGYHNGYLVNG